METEFLLSGEPALGFLMGLLLGMCLPHPCWAWMSGWHPAPGKAEVLGNGLPQTPSARLFYNKGVSERQKAVRWSLGKLSHLPLVKESISKVIIQR